MNKKEAEKLYRQGQQMLGEGQRLIGQVEAWQEAQRIEDEVNGMHNRAAWGCAAFGLIYALFGPACVGWTGEIARSMNIPLTGLEQSIIGFTVALVVQYGFYQLIGHSPWRMAQNGRGAFIREMPYYEQHLHDGD